MQTKPLRQLALLIFAWMLVGAAHAARAQEEPTGRADAPLADGATRAPATTGDAAEPFARLVPVPRHPLRPQRLMRSGGTLIAASLLGVILGTSIGGSSSSCDDDEGYCVDFGPGLAAIGSAVIMAPLFLGGTILVIRGARVRARHRRLSAGVQLTGGRYALTLAGRF